MGLNQNDDKVRRREYNYEVRIRLLRIRKTKARKRRQYLWQKQYNQPNVKAQAIIITKSTKMTVASNHKP